MRWMVPDITIDQKIIGFFGRGEWPGGIRSWGKVRTWIYANEDTKTYGRSGFSIHGGSMPGSAGCIDLTDDNE